MILARGPAVSVALAILAAAPALATPPDILAPSSPWQLNYSDDSCQLARSFGRGDDMVFLYLEQFGPGSVYSARLIGKAFKSDELHAKIKLGESAAAMVTIGTLSGTLDKKPMVAFTMGILPELLPPAQTTPFTPARKAAIARGDGEAMFGIMSAAKVRQLHVKPPRGPELALQTGAMDATVAAMRTCMDALVQHWGLDPAKQRALKRSVAPRNSPGTWLTSDDYPESSLRSGRSSIVNFRVTVDAQGNVTDCAIQRATQGPEFIKKTCDLIRRRARFEPALDAEGNPVASYYINTVKWVAAAP